MAFGPSMESKIEAQMMLLGSDTITDLDRFLMPDLDRCDINGNEIHNGTDYFGGSAYEYEPH